MHFEDNYAEVVVTFFYACLFHVVGVRKNKLSNDYHKRPYKKCNIPGHGIFS